jgi:predicted peptidase
MAQQAQLWTAQDDPDARLGYWLHLPASYTAESGTRWPLILFLHGMGERGDDLKLVKLHGIARVIENQPDFPFITVSPQCPDTVLWAPDELDHLNALLDEVSARYAVDTNRVYLTGLSMGGFGTWHLAARFPERFAAIAPICGGGPVERAQRLRHVPIWAFHGALDDIVPLRASEAMVTAVRAAGGNAQFTVYPEANHDSWTAAYDNPALYTWFLEHTTAER